MDPWEALTPFPPPSLPSRLRRRLSAAASSVVSLEGGAAAACGEGKLRRGGGRSRCHCSPSPLVQQQNAASSPAQGSGGTTAAGQTVTPLSGGRARPVPPSAATSLWVWRAQGLWRRSLEALKSVGWWLSRPRLPYRHPAAAGCAKGALLRPVLCADVLPWVMFTRHPVYKWLVAENEYLGKQGLLMSRRWEGCIVFSCGDEIYVSGEHSWL